MPRLCDRFGGPSAEDFLAEWRYTSNGKWRYPEENGFLLDADGLPIMGNLSLAVGTTVDRFGSEQGACIWTHNFPSYQTPASFDLTNRKKGFYVSAEDAPYAQRALPYFPRIWGMNNSAAFDYPSNY